MSILYQALKEEQRQEKQQARGRVFGNSAAISAGTLLPKLALSPSPVRLATLFACTFGLMLFAGFGVWQLVQPASVPSTASSILQVPAIPQPTPPDVAAPVSTPDLPNTLDEIAALLPPQATAPLPLDDSNLQASNQTHTSLASIQVGNGQIFAPADPADNFTTSALHTPETVIESLAIRVTADPANAIIRAQYGQALAQLGDYASAQQELAAAAQLAPDNAQILYNLAVLYDQMAEPALAIQAYDATLRAQQRRPSAGLNNRQIEQRIQQLMAAN